LEPWGEERADWRNAVSCTYANLEFLPESATLPQLTWPYFAGPLEDFDFDAHRQVLEEHQRKWAEWERERCQVSGVSVQERTQ